MKNEKIKKLVLAAMFCALVFAATFISVPAPTIGGNVNLGDGILLLCAWTLGGAWSVVAAACGAALTDIVGGYAVYAPGTLCIKALMTLTAVLLCRFLPLPKLARRAVSGVAAEIVMIAGYYLYESIFLSYGFAAAAVNLPFNAVQGGFGVLLGCVAAELSDRLGRTQKHG